MTDIAVASASPLIALSQIGRLPLLRLLFHGIVVPDAAWDDVVVRGAGQPGADEVAQAYREGWLRRRTVRDVLAGVVLQATMGPGKSEAITLAQTMNARWVLLDDDLARAHAKRVRRSPKGTVGILLAARQAGLLDELRARGFWLSDRVYHAILQAAGGGP